MQLIVQWVNVTRSRPEVVIIEQAYKKRLLELCNSTEHAKALHDDHYRNGQHPATQWNRLNAVAKLEATEALLPTGRLLPSERKDAAFVVRFEV